MLGIHLEPALDQLDDHRVLVHAFDEPRSQLPMDGDHALDDLLRQFFLFKMTRFPALNPFFSIHHILSKHHLVSPVLRTFPNHPSKNIPPSPPYPHIPFFETHLFL